MPDIATTLTTKGQVTIPKHIRDAKNFKPGDKLIFDLNKEGEIVLRPEMPSKSNLSSRFAKAIGSADIHWPGGTDEIMAFLRGEDE